MNQFGQQSSNGNQLSMGGASFGMNQMQGQQNQNRYQSSGFVQSHYQGIPKQGGGNSAQSNTTPVINHVGYSAGNTFNQHTSSLNSFAGNGNFNSQASTPVLSHFGGYQAQNAQQSSQPYQGTTHFVQQSQPITNQFGFTNAQDTQNRGSFGMSMNSSNAGMHNGNTGMHNSNAGMSSRNAGMGMHSQSQSHGVTNYMSHAGNNPVLQSNSFSNQGPIINRNGFSANGQSSMGMNNSNQQRF